MYDFLENFVCLLVCCPVPGGDPDVHLAGEHVGARCPLCIGREIV